MAKQIIVSNEGLKKLQQELFLHCTKTIPAVLNLEKMLFYGRAFTGSNTAGFTLVLSTKRSLVLPLL